MALFTGPAKFFRRIAMKRNDTTTLDPDDFLKILDENGNSLFTIQNRGNVIIALDQFGRVEWGITGGAGAFQLWDSTSGLYRFAFQTTYTELPGLRIKEGTNKQMGLATLSGGTVTVNTTAVTVNSRIFLTAQNSSGTAGVLGISARTAGASFTITSTSNTDTRQVAWLLVEPTTIV